MNGNTARPERRGYNKEDATMKKLIALALATLMLLSMLPTALAAEYKDKATVKDVQQALNDAGYDCGKPDGAAGKKTKAAITAYQTDKGLEVTGVIDDALLEALGVELSDEGAPAEDTPAEESPAEDAQAVNASDEASQEEEKSSLLPQEIAEKIDLPDGLPDTLDGLAEKYDLETLNILYEQIDLETILHDLLEQGTATLPDLGVEWTEASIATVYVDGNEEEEIRYDMALDSVEGVTTISLDDEYQPSGKYSYMALYLYFENGEVYREFESKKGKLKEAFGETAYLLTEYPRSTKNYHEIIARLNCLDNEYEISIQARDRNGDDIVQWRCVYEKETGRLKDRYYKDPSDNYIHF